MRDYPDLVIVSGPPGSGKTTLARKLAGELHYPLICRDEIRETLMRTRGIQGAHPGDEMTAETNDVFFERVQQEIRRDVSVIIEAAFGYKLWSARIGSLLDADRLKIIQCRLPLALLRDRYAERMDRCPRRRQFHADEAFLSRLDSEGLSMEAYDLFPLGPALTVDTREGYDPGFSDIVEFVRKEAAA